MGETIPRHGLRDRIIVNIVNGLLKLTSKKYQDALEGVIAYGMNAAARDTLENREPPEHWSVYAERAKQMREDYE